jgi:hypothetical protein
MMKAILIRPCDTANTVSVKELSEFKALNRHFDGNVEIAMAPKLPESFCMAIDEEGKFKGLQRNGIGSWLYCSSEHGDYIVGDVFILKIEDGPDGADIVGLSPKDIQRIAKHCRFKIRGG